jgi:vacuolar-type H+-ATPase subunit H
VSVKELEAITKAEKKAEAMLQKAREQGEKMVEEANAITHKEITAAREKVKQTVGNMIDAAKKNSQPQVQKILDDMEARKNEAVQRSQSHKEKAVTLILKRILG